MTTEIDYEELIAIAMSMTRERTEFKVAVENGDDDDAPVGAVERAVLLFFHRRDMQSVEKQRNNNDFQPPTRVFSSATSSAASTRDTPLEAGRERVEKVAVGGIGSVLHSQLGTLSAKDIERYLLDALPHVSHLKIRQWLLQQQKEQEQPISSTSAVSSSTSTALGRKKKNVAKPNESFSKMTLFELLFAARLHRFDDDALANQSKKKRKLRAVQNVDLIDALQEETAKRQRDSAFYSDLEHVESLEDAELVALDLKRDNDGGDAKKCCICFDTFLVDVTLHCLADESHSVCRRCFVHYCDNSDDTRSLETIACPLPQCRQPYDPIVAQVNLPETLVDKIKSRQRELDTRVAVAAGVRATLYCECGIVGVVEERDIGTGTVTCACERAYCLQCGDFMHQGQLCGPPKATIQWIQKHAKMCPNCSEAIEKNHGCNHMTCRTCKHHFCWECLAERCRCYAK